MGWGLVVCVRGGGVGGVQITEMWCQEAMLGVGQIVAMCEDAGAQAKRGIGYVCVRRLLGWGLWVEPNLSGGDLLVVIRGSFWSSERHQQ